MYMGVLERPKNTEFQRLQDGDDAMSVGRRRRDMRLAHHTGIPYAAGLFERSLWYCMGTSLTCVGI